MNVVKNLRATAATFVRLVFTPQLLYASVVAATNLLVAIAIMSPQCA